MGNVTSSHRLKGAFNSMFTQRTKSINQRDTGLNLH